jgi:hypothetical protein
MERTHQGGEERNGRLLECTVADGLWEENNKNRKGQRSNDPVGTVSGGGWMEREIEPIKAAKTPRVYRIGQPLGGE